MRKYVIIARKISSHNVTRTLILLSQYSQISAINFGVFGVIMIIINTTNPPPHPTNTSHKKHTNINNNPPPPKKYKKTRSAL